MNDWATSAHLSIAEWYAGKRIFITGGTGFMGKALIEKLLRSCPDVDKVYILIRPKKGRDIDERLEQIFNDQLFDTVRHTNPSIFQKVIPIIGDIGSENLGITEEDRKTLSTNVDIVFHSAATIRFNEELSKSIDLNILGTKRMLDLASTITSLEAFVHVSTAYCYCQQRDLEEKFYSTKSKVQNVIKLTEILDDKLLEEITPKLLEGRPNTYTFTKALTEQLLQENKYNFPIAIMRPSIVTSTWKEPFPGWIDNVNGPTGIYLAVGNGLLRYLIAKEDGVADIVPVDGCVNVLICVAWKTANSRLPMKIYNYTSGTINPITWGHMRVKALGYMRTYPQDNMFWLPHCTFVDSKWSYNVGNMLTVNVLAGLVDFFCVLAGKPRRLVKITNKIQAMTEILEFFTTRDWNFQTKVTMELYREMCEEDRKTFYFDLNDLNWEEYLIEFVCGIKKYILKEDLKKIEKARRNQKRFYLLNLATKTTLVILTYKLFVDRTPLGQKLRHQGFDRAMGVVSYLGALSSGRS